MPRRTNRTTKKQSVDQKFLDNIDIERTATKDFVLMMFEQEGFKPGALIKAKHDILGIVEILPNEHGDGTRQVVTVNSDDGVPMKAIYDTRSFKKSFIHKGGTAMFLDVDCEMALSGSGYVVMKLLIDEKILSVSYFPMDDLKNSGTSWFFREWKRL